MKVREDQPAIEAKHALYDLTTHELEVIHIALSYYHFLGAFDRQIASELVTALIAYRKVTV